MYSLEQKKRAIELLIKYDGSIAAVIRELGYPNRQTLYNWIHDYQSTGTISEHGEVFNQKQQVMLQNMQVAVNYYLEHGKSLSKTIRALGFPRSRETLKRWIDELAPGEHYMVQSQDSRKCSDIKISTKFKALFDLSDEEQVVREVSEHYGVECAALYHWRAHPQKNAIITRKGKRKADGVTPEEKLKKVEEELAAKKALLKSAKAEIEAKIKQIE